MLVSFYRKPGLAATVQTYMSESTLSETVEGTLGQSRVVPYTENKYSLIDMSSLAPPARAGVRGACSPRYNARFWVRSNPIEMSNLLLTVDCFAVDLLAKTCKFFIDSI